MAKSLRSKRKRKMRAVKRVRYGEKESKRLEAMVRKTLDREKDVLPKDTEMTSAEPQPEAMDVGQKVKRDPQSLRDENGHYPSWMSRREVKKRQLRLKRLKSKKK